MVRKHPCLRNKHFPLPIEKNVVTLHSKNSKTHHYEKNSYHFFRIYGYRRIILLPGQRPAKMKLDNPN